MKIRREKFNIKGNPEFGQKVEKPKKGKDSYTRKKKHKKKDD